MDIGKEIRALIKNTTEEERAIAMVLFDTGCRVSELVGINLRDLKINDDKTKKMVVTIRILGKGGKNGSLDSTNKH